MTRIFKGFFVAIYRALVGALYGMLLWAPVGILLLVGVVWQQTDLAGFSTELHLWVGLLALIGGFIGALLGVGGGVLSGLFTGALIGYFGWLAVTGPAAGPLGGPEGVGNGAMIVGSAIDLSFLIGLGTSVGLVGGLVGGLMTGVAGTRPAQGDEQVKLGLLLGITSLLAFSFLTALIMYDAGVISEIAKFSLAGAGSAFALPETEPEPLMVFGGGIATMVIGLILIATLPPLSRRGRSIYGDVESAGGLMRQLQLNLWRALLPLSVGLICEVLFTQAIGSLMGEARVGVGAVLGVGLANGLEEWIENRGEEPDQRTRRPGLMIWATVLAAIVIAALQGYLFPTL